MKIWNKGKKSLIDEEIDSVILNMAELEADSDEYTKMVNNLEVLMKARSYDKDQTKVSKDTLWTVGGSIVGIVVLVGYEHAHIITSKALGFIVKGRV